LVTTDAFGCNCFLDPPYNKAKDFQRLKQIYLRTKMAQICMRETTDADIENILFVEREAFNSNVEANLVKDLLADPSAKPVLSIIAFVKDQVVGHILFTAAHLLSIPKVEVSLLAPLAIIPKFQKQGVGGNLIKKGVELLSKSNVDLVFVLGYPKYYPRYGFIPAGKLGFEASYSIPEKDADAWMVLALRPDLIGKISGRVVCCDALDKPQYWRE
jgi:putative acetyltransferase